MFVPIFLNTFSNNRPLNRFKGRFCPVKSGHNRDTRKFNSLIISSIHWDNRDTYLSRNRDTLVSRLSQRICLTIRYLVFVLSRWCPDFKGVKSLDISTLGVLVVEKIGTSPFFTFYGKMP